MDKMTHAKVNLNNLLMGLSVALDKAFTPNRYQLPYNSQRVTYIALRLASYVNFEDKYLADIAAYGLLYRFELLEDTIKDIPFLDNSHIDDTTNEIMKLSLLVEENLEVKSNVVINSSQIEEIVNSTTLSDTIKENFIDLSEDMTFWLDLTNTLQLPTLIYNFLQDFTQEMEYSKLIEFSSIVHNLVNSSTTLETSSDIANKCKLMCEHYTMDNKDVARLVIAINLHNLGKLFIPKDIYRKKEPLTQEEKVMVQSIPYFTSTTLSMIYGFDDIAKSCSFFNEKLDGSGKLYEMDGTGLSLKDRLMAILIIYQALLESRSYRDAYTHNEAIEILKSDANSGKLDMALIEDIDKVFKG